MEEWPYRLVAFTGFFCICLIAWLSGTRRRVNGKVVIGSMGLAWVIGISLILLGVILVVDGIGFFFGKPLIPVGT